MWHPILVVLDTVVLGFWEVEEVPPLDNVRVEVVYANHCPIVLDVTYLLFILSPNGSTWTSSQSQKYQTDMTPPLVWTLSFLPTPNP